MIPLAVRRPRPPRGSLPGLGGGVGGEVEEPSSMERMSASGDKVCLSQSRHLANGSCEGLQG